MQAIVHWINEGRWDVMDVGKLPGEMQQENALGLVRYEDGKKYLGKVLLISGEYERCYRLFFLPFVAKDSSASDFRVT